LLITDSPLPNFREETRLKKETATCKRKARMKPILSNKRYAKLVLAVLILLTTCGCNAVISKRPVGEKSAKIMAKDWEGNWLSPDGPAKVKVVDPDKGIIKVFWLEDDKEGKPGMKTAEVELRQSGEWLFANTRAEDKGESRGYVWARIKNEDRQIIAWLPDNKAFARLVKDGVLPGKNDGDDMILDELKPQHLQIITSGERGLLFEWDKPAVFVKVAN
jgi:hypothetical protein